MESQKPILKILNDIILIARSEAISLPKIILVGETKSGKTSLLERLVGRDFIPRDAVDASFTMNHPLELHLVNLAKDDTSAPEGLKEFWKLHQSQKIFDSQEVKLEISRLCQHRSGIEKNDQDKMQLTLYSDKVPNLTIVDTPGLNRVPVVDGKKQESIILNLISEPNSIILIVNDFTINFSKSESVKLAQLVDPDGRRTLIAITKLDMGININAKESLCLNDVPVPCIALRNRSTQEILTSIPIEVSIHNEASFFKEKYPDMASTNGILYLSKMLSKIIISEVVNSLNRLNDDIKLELCNLQVQLNTSSKFPDLQVTAVQKDSTLPTCGLNEDTKGSLIICWDIQNLGVPTDTSAFELAMRIRDYFSEEFFILDFSCCTDVLKSKKSVVDGLNEANVNVLHVSSDVKNSADFKLLAHMRKFVSMPNNQCSVALISNDSDFAQDIIDFRYNNGVNFISVSSAVGSKRLRRACQKCVNYEIFTQSLDITEKKKPEETLPKNTKSGKGGSTTSRWKRPKSERSCTGHVPKSKLKGSLEVTKEIHVEQRQVGKSNSSTSEDPTKENGSQPPAKRLKLSSQEQPTAEESYLPDSLKILLIPGDETLFSGSPPVPGSTSRPPPVPEVLPEDVENPLNELITYFEEMDYDELEIIGTQIYNTMFGPAGSLNTEYLLDLLQVGITSDVLSVIFGRLFIDFTFFGE